MSLIFYFKSFVITMVLSLPYVIYARSANFENGMETGLNILFGQIGNIIMVELN